ncbi:hypothetical protein B0H10DRAFT_1968398 [Mycena sp. CBHHK59/15]|nr:hypothetical protein B0H10DRAFT_1968398 [Mycena sp. CBHHK59/15]
MPPHKGPLWDFFWTGEKQNQHHFKAHCLGCISSKRPTVIDVDDIGNGTGPGPVALEAETWFHAGFNDCPPDRLSPCFGECEKGCKAGKGREIHGIDFKNQYRGCIVL